MRKNNTIQKVLKLMKPHMYFLILSLIFSVVYVVLTLYAPILVGDAVDFIIGKEQVDFAAIFEILKQIAVIVVVASLAQWFMNLCNNALTYRVVKDHKKQ